MAQIEPPKIQAPRVTEIGVQVDPPPENKGTQMTPPSSGARMRANTQQMFYDKMQQANNPFTAQEQFYDPNERQTPINYDDPNDHRNYANGPDLALPQINNLGNQMVYNDFEYVGYQTRDKFQSDTRSTRFNVQASPKR